MVTSAACSGSPGTLPGRGPLVAQLRGDVDLGPLRSRPDFRLPISDLAFPTEQFVR